MVKFIVIGLVLAVLIFGYGKFREDQHREATAGTADNNGGGGRSGAHGHLIRAISVPTIENGLTDIGHSVMTTRDFDPITLSAGTGEKIVVGLTRKASYDIYIMQMGEWELFDHVEAGEDRFVDPSEIPGVEAIGYRLSPGQGPQLPFGYAKYRGPMPQTGDWYPACFHVETVTARRGAPAPGSRDGPN